MSKKHINNALWEGVKFLARQLVLFGLPSILGAIANTKPEYGFAIGAGLAFIDKVIHKLPNEYKGLLPF